MNASAGKEGDDAPEASRRRFFENNIRGEVDDAYDVSIVLSRHLRRLAMRCGVAGLEDSRSVLDEAALEIDAIAGILAYVAEKPGFRYDDEAVLDEEVIEMDTNVSSEPAETPTDIYIPAHPTLALPHHYLPDAP